LIWPGHEGFVTIVNLGSCAKSNDSLLTFFFQKLAAGMSMHEFQEIGECSTNTVMITMHSIL